RYLLYATMRADGTSKYQTKWGYFPTVGAGWVVTGEGFMKDVRAMDYLKLRGSWGRLGNSSVAASDGAMTTELVYTAIGDQRFPGSTTTANYAVLGWEVVEESNFGLSARFLDNRLSVEADYFFRDTKNAVIPNVIPGTNGYLRKNSGVIRNSGLELVLNWNDAFADGKLRYGVGVNIATLKNEARNLYGQPYIDGGTAEFRQRTVVGHPLLSFFGYEVAGVYQNEAEVAAGPATAQEVVPGDFRFKDQNGDNIIDDSDRVLLGSYLPSFSYGANFFVAYRGFELSASFCGQTGNKILNRKRGEYIWTNDTNIDAELAKNLWRGEGTSNKYPSSAGLRKGWNQSMSTYFVEDGSFFRIQNIRLSYNLKNKKILGVDLPDIGVFLVADRPLTVFKYNGFNPEVANGIDSQTYPVPAVYTVGLNLKF
ncbi:MAG: TonB-dependent receptor, partial [Prevotellaceae bacterium]|nr:TonB-dependent receptor [Prevotellaceae bacterium]